MKCQKRVKEKFISNIFTVRFLIFTLVFAMVTHSPQTFEAAPSSGTIRYISHDGTDYTDCTGGTKEFPWKTWRSAHTNGCINPGDKIYFKEGTYECGDGTFGNSDVDHIPFDGAENNPVTISPDPGASGDWPVKFKGSFRINGSWGSFEGIEFESGPSTEPIIQIAASHITLKNNYIHEPERDVDLTIRTCPFNNVCLKILAGKYVQNEDIKMIGNEISYCRDPLDVTGAKDIVYINNHVHHFWAMQIKGGSENVLVANNKIHDARMGVNGGGMGCDFGYCGSPVLPTLPVEERFVTKNVTIENNLIYNIFGWDAISINGMHDGNISHNTIYRENDNGWIIISEKHGSDFMDQYAEEYCSGNPEACSECSYGKTSCWHIKFSAKNVNFRNNIISRKTDSMIYAIDNADITGFSGSNNIYHNSNGTVQFKIGSQNYYGLDDFPNESNSYEHNPNMTNPAAEDFTLAKDSFAIDKGIALGVECDIAGNRRDESPDIGAYEYCGDNCHGLEPPSPPTRLRVGK